ncbi:HlyD family type I secretion periplasmic adaptor subunit [Xylophilus sp. GOD-11R]|uniref:HlyD family type I secretion periplasmic adaptor subunit n=1 Tax=Xylophilus sp. GOD-11R TaxID=3089814 RepID=UPI00298C06D9|nr:HlyD family type I secretion periplasmic adaptor subunit [Xylophilus sp. GOD-11R]WPB56477.1 HlyD family type I secretion periplasmic adaptor subunit [Xylophilus sp. GOD-11R]
MSVVMPPGGVAAAADTVDTLDGAALDLQIGPPAHLARMVSLGLCAMAAVALVFACLAPVDIVVSAQGRVIAPGHSKVLQPLEAGVVKTIAVRDGQTVRAGDLLLELDNTATHADRERLQHQWWEAQGDVARLSALLAGSSVLPPDGADGAPADGAVPPADGTMPAGLRRGQQALLESRAAEHRSRIASLQADIVRRQAEQAAIAAGIVQADASLPLVRKKNEMRETLARSGHLAEAGVIDSRLELINAEKELAVQQRRLEESRAGHASAVQQLAQAQAEFRARSGADMAEAFRRRETARQELVKATQREGMQQLRSPIDGIVQQLAVTTVGGVVTPAQALLTVVPADAAMEVEAQVLNRDIGHVHPGQRVVTKVETFDFTRYGYIEGAVSWVGSDAMADPKLGPVYPVRVLLKELRTSSAVDGVAGAVRAGMTVTVDMRVGERRLIEYFLAPMLRYRREALRER